MKVIEGEFGSQKARKSEHRKRVREAVQMWIFTIGVLLGGTGLVLLGLTAVFATAPTINISGAFFAALLVLVIIAFGGMAMLRGIRDELAANNDRFEEPQDEEET